MGLQLHGMIPRMHIAPGVTELVIALVATAKLAWHVAVIVLAYKIWLRVKHLPT